MTNRIIILKLKYKSEKNMIEKIGGYIAEQILNNPDRTIEADEKLISSGLVDSFSLVDLALFVENEFGVRIDDTELNAETFDSLTELAEMIKQRL